MFEKEDENSPFFHRYCNMMRAKLNTTVEKEEKLMQKIEKSLSKYEV